MARILIVDDDAAVRDILTLYFKGKGYTVTAVESGPLALACFPVFRPDLVLLDILMPGMDGITVLSQMKHLNPAACVIMLTGVAHDEIAREAIRRGADDYLTKPFELEQLEMQLSIHMLFHKKEDG